jgi:hypothetical protein
LLAAFMAILGGSDAWALDPLRTDILTLRLGMARTEVLNHLIAQGYQASDDGPNSLRARTKDGGLRVELTSDGRVRRVTYMFAGHAANEAVMIHDSMLDHYGQPSAEAPLTWCVTPSPDRRCPRDQPSLSFGLGKDGKAILTLATSADP